MSSLQLFSEPFARTGNMAAEGFRRLLGRPTLELLPTVLREAIQNVLDAATGVIGPTVRIRVRTLSADQITALRERILSEMPDTDATRAGIAAAIRKPELRVLEICDFGTEGLSGPTRADAPHDGEEPLNFVNFLRNVGAARDTHHGGGTYGYGKSSLYAMSSCATIVVDSQTRVAGRPERRLMACHLGAAFDAAGDDGIRRRYTGRHWWGVREDEGSIEPAVGSSAATLAGALGMPNRDERDTGTSILVIDPLLGGDLQSSIEDIVEIILWNFWPRMAASTAAERKLCVEVELEGRRIEVPCPEEFPPLDLFAAALADHRAGNGSLKAVRCGNPKKFLGSIAIRNGLRAERRGPAARTDSRIPKQASHIALMRPVELVVKYVEGEPLTDRRFDWVGVFICSDEDEVEEAFALAEPPAHDDWIPDNLPKGNAKTFVRVALRKINEVAFPRTQVAGPSGEDGLPVPSLAATAARLGQFLDRVSASGPGKSVRKKGQAGARKPLAISAPRFGGLEIGGDGCILARFDAELQNDGSDADLHLIAEPHLVVDGGLTAPDDLPAGYEVRVERISLGDVTTEEPRLHAGLRDGPVAVLVRAVPGAAVGLRLRLQSGGVT